MPLRDDLLAPIAGPNPAGADLRYDPIYDKIKEARREDDDIPQGDWQQDRKTADFAAVVKMAGETIATRTKDLQLTAWLTEALLKREGFAGLRDGLGALTAMLDTFWDTLYPELEDGDAELRAGPLEWVGSRLDVAVRTAPVTRAGYGLLKYRESRTVIAEDVARDDFDKGKQREAQLAEGKLPPEEFDKAFAATPKAYYVSLVADLDGALAAVATLDTMADEKFGGDAPSFGGLRSALTDVRHLAVQLLDRKRETEPDPVADGPAGDAEMALSDAGATAAPTGGSVSAEPTSVADAGARIAAAARHLRQADPTSAAPYALLRGLRWSELREGAERGAPNPKLLEAPATAVRARLKTLLLDGQWPALLEAAEAVMATPQGRGWLDLQRYVLTACASSGSDYAAVAHTVREALRALLADLPALLEMTLMDDTPVANTETRGWLASEGLLPDEAAAAARTARGEDDAHEEAPRGTSAYARAMAEVRAGRVQVGLGVLMRELANERSPRGRFLRKTEIAAAMVEAGLHTVATPILGELLEMIAEHKLEQWEDGEVVARPLALLCRCLDATGSDASARETHYLAICRLDPMTALTLPAS
jgi:type VI secretion system protein ImpA